MEKAMAPHPSTLAWKMSWMEEPSGLQSMVSRRVGHDFPFTFTFHFHALEKEMATHSSVLAWRIPGMGEPGMLMSMGLHRVGHHWSDLEAAACGSNYCTIALISHASKIMLIIFQARLQQYVNCELPDVQACFTKGRGTKYHIANICWIIEKARQFKITIYFCFIDGAKDFNRVDHNKLWKILKEMGIPDHLTCLLRSPS